MAESEAVYSVVIQVAMQAATTVFLAIRKANTSPISGTNTVSLRDVV